jgi:hypothetical protein
MIVWDMSHSQSSQYPGNGELAVEVLMVDAPIKSLFPTCRGRTMMSTGMNLWYVTVTLHTFILVYNCFLHFQVKKPISTPSRLSEDLADMSIA